MKTILITGGSRGIGEAIVRQSVGKYNVAFTYNTNHQMANDLVDKLKSDGAVATFKCDISNACEVKAMISAVHARFSNIDILVNSAGISESKQFQDISNESWRNMFAVNVDGAFYVSKEVLPDMLTRKNGAIINISSMWGVYGASMETHYSASKAALIGLTKSLSKELAPSNITVNAVAPGAIDTDMMRVCSSHEITNFCQEIPLGRLGTAKEVAEAVLYLAEARYITGQVLCVTGGM